MDCSYKRLANIQSVARKAFEDAVQDAPPLMEKNPLHGWTCRKKEAPGEKDDVDPFDQKEQVAIIAALLDQAANMIHVCILDRPTHFGACRARLVGCGLA